MNRRKRAFTALVVSLFAGVFLSSIDFILSTPRIALPALAVFALVLAIARSSFNRLFDSSTNTTVYLSHDSLVRKSRKSEERLSIDEIRGMRVKRTVKGPIREIRIVRAQAGTVYFNGLADFERFKDDLIETAGNDVAVREMREPIDLDHPAFYPVFGVLVGVLSSVFFRIVLRIDEADFRYFQIGVGIFLLCMGTGFVVKRPIEGTYGNKGRPADYILGLLMLSLSVFLIWFS